MHTITIKEEARKLIDNLPEESTWSDLMYEIYVRREIELGLADIDAGRTVEMDEVKKIFGIGRWK